MTSFSLSLRLLVVGSKNTTTLFSLLGAEAIEIENQEDLYQVIKDLEPQAKEIGGILLESWLYDEEDRGFQRLQKGTIPFLVLPSSSNQNSGYEALEKLTEKAMGMKVAL